ncbi:hypothetical protein ACO0M4_35135 [Streptomyces sp. RGM 3693]|uniref:hypothetical protein n=1 Tax=Streptomyces sp. RGM 3693 TaxID=3413284 RepID=UPI003D27F941
MTSRPFTKRPASKSPKVNGTSTTHPTISQPRLRRRPRPLAATALAGLLTLTACQPGAQDQPDPQGARHPAALPENATPCASVTPAPSPAPDPILTRLAWRSEELPDGSLRTTVGDIDAAPKDPRTVRRADYRAPDSRTDCANVKILTVHGWWCTTTVSRTVQDGEIVVGGARPRARIHSAGFRTHCAGRTARMRQHYEIQRDSWSGWRPYGERGYTPWTPAQDQSGGPVAASCPRGRVGTYAYRLAVTVEVAGLTVDDSPAASPRIRTDCGTGVS